VSRILVHDPRLHGEGRSVSLDAVGHDVVSCGSPEALVAALSGRRAALLVYVLHDLTRDVQFLSAVRRTAPRLPIVLLGEPATLEERRAIQDLRPTYFGVFPLDEQELADAVHAALGTESAARRHWLAWG
jgi:DNA-binding NtrC family response regulator